MIDRIEIDPRRCGGTPVIRGTRIPVAVVLDQLASGEDWESLLKGYPGLTREDIQAATLFAKASAIDCCRR
ncbi:MAG: DUF433 domain-containing protein [Pirellulales bacterium]|nr:DUF433 domain-containing protein [Pirellulales bacterium]